MRASWYFWSVSLHTYQSCLSEVRVARLLKPRVLVRGVVQHQLGEDPHPPLVRLIQKRLEVVEVAVDGEDLVVVRRVVAVVAERALQKREQPQRVDAQPLEVRELFAEAREVAVAIIRGIKKRADVELVNDGVLVPEGVVSGSPWSVHPWFVDSFL